MMRISTFGELLDRIVVIIDNTFIITLSDTRKERAIQSAFGRDPGDDEAITNALIERRLVEDQIAQFREIEVSDAAVAERLSTITKPAGISDTELREAVAGELRRYEFINERFGLFIRVSDDESRKYYEETLIPALRLKGEPIPPAEQVTEAIRQNIVAEKMKVEVDAWLTELRRRSTIEKIPE